METEKLGLKYLGAIPYDPQVEDAIGNEDKTAQHGHWQKASANSKKHNHS